MKYSAKNFTYTIDWFNLNKSSEVRRLCHVCIAPISTLKTFTPCLNISWENGIILWDTDREAPPEIKNTIERHLKLMAFL